MDCPNDINFDTEISEERYIEILDHSKDEEDDTCIEKNNIIVNQPLNKQMGRILKCEQITDDRRRTPSDGKSSH
jgi:hypothetical protein